MLLIRTVVVAIAACLTRKQTHIAFGVAGPAGGSINNITREKRTETALLFFQTISFFSIVYCVLSKFCDKFIIYSLFFHKAHLEFEWEKNK